MTDGLAPGTPAPGTLQGLEAAVAQEGSSPRAGAPPRTGQRGRLLWEYQGPRAHPILYAGLLVFGFVLATGSLENLLREGRSGIYAAYAAPFAATLAVTAALWAGPVRIHENGVAPSRPLLLRWLRPFVAWDDCVACYPVSYDVTGAFVSPFASSDGKVTQRGIGLELRGGAVEIVRFTPSRFTLGRERSRGYKEAWPLVETLWAGKGRPLVPAQPPIPPAERDRLLAQARRPFLPFWAIVALFCSAAPITLGLALLGVPDGAAIATGLLAPLGTSLLSFRRSVERNRILNTLSKAALAQEAAA